MKTFDLLKKTESDLRLSGISSPRLESELLLAYILGCSRADLYGSKFDEISNDFAEKFLGLIKRREKKEPIAYLLGTKEFMGLSFQVTRATLIPRPETELLVTAVEDFFKKTEHEQSILDLGTGTGCIALSLAHRNPSFKITAIDFSEEALHVARENANNLDVSSQVSFLKRDILDPSFWDELPRFQALVSNPPYIGECEAQGLSKDVLDYEPRSALFAEHEGLAFYESFAKNARKCLHKNGRLFLELSPVIYESVIKIFKENSWTLQETIRDYTGHKRHIVLS